MVRKINRRWLIAARAIFVNQIVVVIQFEANIDFQVSGKTFFAIYANISKMQNIAFGIE